MKKILKGLFYGVIGIFIISAIATFAAINDTSKVVSNNGTEDVNDDDPAQLGDTVQVGDSGKFKCGKDFPAGRYKATNIGEGSNFVVHSPDNDLKVNTILGKDADYTFWAEDGDLIDTGARVRLIPVE